jgi:hypothetical protein
MDDQNTNKRAQCLLENSCNNIKTQCAKQKLNRKVWVGNKTKDIETGAENQHKACVKTCGEKITKRNERNK